MPTTSDGLLTLAQRVEETEALDRAVPLLQAAARPFDGAAIRPVLAGRWLGHALHPLLTDYPLGCWTSATMLDMVGGKGARVASQRLVGIGVLAALPTAASGLSDWLHVDQRSQRVGVAHAATNSAALTLYAASYLARRRGRQGRGVVLGVLGGLSAIAGGFFGGHLTLTAAVTRDNALIPGDDGDSAVSIDAMSTELASGRLGTASGGLPPSPAD